MPSSSIHHRPIHSFVIRGGRMTTKQQAGWQSAASRYLLQTPDQVAAWVDSCAKPVVLDIGFGMGQALVDMAVARPQECFLGVEVHRPGIGQVMADLEAAHIDHVRIFANDVNHLLDQGLTPGSIERCQVYFPDPWPKKRHHKRRLVQALFVQRLQPLLRRGGKLHIATDWEPYAQAILSMMPLPGWRLCHEHLHQRPDFRPETKYERRGQRLGHVIYDLIYETCAE